MQRAISCASVTSVEAACAAIRHAGAVGARSAAPRGTRVSVGGFMHGNP
jgi:hypothetical protein